jgi:hypothetical protein
MRIAKAEFWGTPNGFGVPHMVFACFSRTAGPIGLKLGWWTRTACPQMVLEFERASATNKKVEFWGTPNGVLGYPIWFFHVSHEPLGRSLSTLGVKVL